ncbi:hypothetical protein SBV1_3100002 [Verrucomicrobia bacterium]|nr:hypothetical protein SBV1_3100002 [Verrucomicrobiota bacterium]
MAAPKLTAKQVQHTLEVLLRVKVDPSSMHLNAKQLQALARLQASVARRDRLIDCVQPLVETALHNLLYEVWALQVTSVLSTVELPEDEVSRWYAVLALIGNLVWAATVFFEPEFLWTIPWTVSKEEARKFALQVGMSFGGAIVGSGILTPGKKAA